ncbi:MAG: hypothetical protein QNJ82_12015 [Gammaproteobacteria bacterium]|nr:hypothetical protein [Gammaproteobacteria bacterium]
MMHQRRILAQIPQHEIEKPLKPPALGAASIQEWFEIRGIRAHPGAPLKTLTQIRDLGGQNDYRTRRWSKDRYPALWRQNGRYLSRCGEAVLRRRVDARLGGSWIDDNGHPTLELDGAPDIRAPRRAQQVRRAELELVEIEAEAASIRHAVEPSLDADSRKCPRCLSHITNARWRTGAVQIAQRGLSLGGTD